jgi:hypothetical protein
MSRRWAWLTLLLIIAVSALSGYLAGLKHGAKIEYDRLKQDERNRAALCGYGQYHLEQFRKQQLEELPSFKELLGITVEE